MSSNRLNTQRQQKILLLLALQDNITTDMLSLRLQQPKALIEEDITALIKVGLLKENRNKNHKEMKYDTK